jgi:isobutyryl-CoA mutase
VNAALQEDVQGIAISSYQGGHMEFFKYMIDLLRERGGDNIKVFGGGGGVIVHEEIAELHAYGVARIYTPEDGRRMGLQGMIDDMMDKADFDLLGDGAIRPGRARRRRRALARVITALQDERIATFTATSCMPLRIAAAWCRCSASPAPAVPANHR